MTKEEAKKEEAAKGKKKKKGGKAQLAVFLIALCVFIISGVRLLGILKDYRDSNAEYEEITDDFTHRRDGTAASSDAAAASAPAPAENGMGEEQDIIEDAGPPLSVDWASLQAINPDIVGWIYVDGEPSISYPVLHADDNDYYLHRTFRKEHKYAGSIFMECSNNPDFADPDTIVYGHNMRNGSMFGLLKFLEDKYAEHPYFWILTPNGNYRYHIYAMFRTDVSSAVYTLFPEQNEEFLEWEQNLQKASAVPNSVPLTKNDKTVILSTCTSDKSKRTVVIGKCVSSVKPKRAAS